MKASARRILVEAARDPGWVPVHALGDRELWTPPRVKKALIDAFRMLRKVGGRVGPAQLRAVWPEFQNNPEDYPPEKPKTSPYATDMTVTRMEVVLLGWRQDGIDHPPWLAGPLLDTEEREKLLQWIYAVMRGESTRDLCERKGWTAPTFKRHRDRAAAMIADRLNRAQIDVW